jgi:hypothetical protein
MKTTLLTSAASVLALPMLPGCFDDSIGSCADVPAPRRLRSVTWTRELRLSSPEAARWAATRRRLRMLRTRTSARAMSQQPSRPMAAARMQRPTPEGTSY